MLNGTAIFLDFLLALMILSIRTDRPVQMVQTVTEGAVRSETTLFAIVSA